MAERWWMMEAATAASMLKSNEQQGLSQAEAKERLQNVGKNTIPQNPPMPIWKIFCSQIESVIVWLLIAAAVIAGLLGEWIDATVILIITLLNLLMGFLQEWRSIRATEALTKIAEKMTKVIREGKIRSCPVEDVVPGDLLLLEAGDEVPADARIIRNYGLKTQEAPLTGESVGVSKQAKPIHERYLVPADQRNMLFRGTSVIYGKGQAVVTETGRNTEIGKIAQLTQEIEKGDSPLQEDLQQLGHQLVLLCLLVMVVVFAIGFFQGFPTYAILMTALSLAVAAIPEGLPAVVTIALAIGMHKMVSRNALIRRLAAVETLGSTSVICTDKTGTLTENKMRIRSIWVDGKEVTVTGHGYIPEGEFQVDGKVIDPKQEKELSLLLRCGAFCNSAGLQHKEGVWEITGDPTEAALLVIAEQAKISPQGTETGEVPFDSDRKMMSVGIEENGCHLYVKGAPDVVLERSSSIACNGEVVPLAKEEKEKLLAQLQHYAAKGLRVLAIAYRTIKPKKKISPELEDNLTFLGLVAMQDPPRKEVAEVVQQCLRAGIRPMMLTGDHLDTAVAIGKELDILGNGQAIEGCALEKMGEKELQEAIKQINVVGRVASAHKSRIVDALQKNGEVVAMTGDGVNDAPAIEKADIGIAMGITGTDVTKSVADMVILDDNFSSIVSAVRQGRGVFDNIVRFSSYLLSCNLAEILVVFFGILFFANTQHTTMGILAPIHLLWINLVTDGMPAIALAFDPLSPYAMKKPPRPRSAPLLSRPLMMRFILLSFCIAVLTIALFALSLNQGLEIAQTTAFTMLVVLELLKPFLLHKSYGMKAAVNPLLLFAVVLSLLLQLVVLYAPPVQTLFKTMPLGTEQWLYIAAGAALFILAARAILPDFVGQHGTHTPSNGADDQNIR